MERQREQVEEVAVRHGLELVLLFGSRARGRTHAKSDTDIAILARERLPFSVIDAIARDLRPVFGSDVDVVDLQAAPPLLAGRIARDGKLLVGTPRAFGRARVRCTARYLDFHPHLGRRRSSLRRTFRV